jgi:hypothetical protein
VTWFTDRSRSAIISSRFRKLRPNRRYQRTHKRIISALKCRPRNAAGRDRCMNCQRIRPPHPALQHFQRKRVGNAVDPAKCIERGIICKHGRAHNPNLNKAQVLPVAEFS